MKKLALITTTLLASATTLSAGELENLRAANAEHKRQITALEKEIDNLYSLLEKEMRNNGKKPISKQLVAQKSSASYTVQKGDTLYKIARDHKVSLSSLMKTNSLGSASVLKIGQKLSIPGVSVQKKQISVVTTNQPSQLADLPQLPSPKSNTKYKILRGDTFFGIAKRHNVSVTSLTKLNPAIDPSSLAVGQVINLPSGTKIVKLKQSVKQAPIKKKAVFAPTVNTPEPKKITSTPVVAAKKSTPVSSQPEPQVMQSVTLSSPMTLQQLADKHKTSVDAINALNNWNYRPTIKLARGSEIYLPN